MQDADKSLPVDSAVFAVGAGDPSVELERWAAVAASHLELRCLAIYVARQIVIPELVGMLGKAGGRAPWVVVRPGAFVADETADENAGSAKERMLVTDDLRCNGIVSRERVARVLADLAMGSSKTAESCSGKVLGVYDRSRMISHPKGVKEYYP